jgi:hypothetical protein
LNGFVIIPIRKNLGYEISVSAHSRTISIRLLNGQESGAANLRISYDQYALANRWAGLGRKFGAPGINLADV